MNAKYIKMIQRMKSGGKKEWCVYLLRCGDGSLYTGITKNIETRLKQHNTGKGAAYTRSHLPVELVYHEARFTRSKALIREAQIKRFPRARKEKLLGTVDKVVQ
jgi:predicted GIY-YIG superfamily endonuclease